MTNLCLQIIENSAKIPSFSSFEERIHSYLIGLVRDKIDIRFKVVDERNLIFYLPGKLPDLVVLTAHLDKINHFGEEFPQELPFWMNETEICGQLDNTVGIGITMATLIESIGKNRPSIMVLLSEMEESYGLKYHPQLLRNGGNGLNHGMGALRLCKWMKKQQISPDAIITIDTTPLFKGEPGVALYSKHWEFTKTVPSEAEIKATEDLVRMFTTINPNLKLANNTNDYLHYGAEMNRNAKTPIPSIAIEPAIFPYHTKNEKVFIKDILEVKQLVATFLDSYAQQEDQNR